MLAYTLTKRFFEIYSGFGHRIKIYAAFQELYSPSQKRIGQSTDSRSRVFLDLPPNNSHNFLAMILCYKDFGSYKGSYSVRTTTKEFDWRVEDSLHSYFPFFEICDSCLDIVPKSTFSVTDGDSRIGFRCFGASTGEILGFHLLYKMDITITDECDSTTVNADKERTHFSEQWESLRNDINWLSIPRGRHDYFDRCKSYSSFPR
ncbi:hypothetical protein POM88_034013 [Heracleum sosnowskyi]|uniref:Uncharacterized protein n=1 Tax=Heracleum sosnowskyi TaxID=360622 RepID=A0AAD8MBU7_9APIA|nr:hypothetical protein POM88_034013 [Heracleum sosnowskyi]